MTLDDVSLWEMMRRKASSLGLRLWISPADGALHVLNQCDNDTSEDAFRTVHEASAYLSGYSDAVANFKAGRVPEGLK